MIQTNCELPIDLLDANTTINDYDFVLFHLYATNPTYREYYNGLRRYLPGRFMMLDNSAYEFYIKNQKLDTEGFLHAIEDLEPDIFLAPDVLMDKERTKEYVDLFAEYEFENSQMMVVVQGNSEAEFLECLEEYKEMGIQYIAIPFHNQFFTQYSYLDNSEMNIHLRNSWRLRVGSIREDDEYALGRTLFLHRYKDIFSNDFQYVHLLGSHNPEEKYFDQDLEFIKSMDTGYPVKCAIEGHKLGEEDSKPNIIIDDFINKSTSDQARQLIINNVNSFKSF